MNDKKKIALDAFAAHGQNADAIMASKLERYGTENIAQQGLDGIIARMLDKLSRAKNLSKGVSAADNESLLDTFLDLRNYSQIASCVASGSWPDTAASNDNATVEPGDCLQVLSSANIYQPKIVGDVGYDISASKQTVLEVSKKIQRIETGVRVKLPKGYWAEIRGRSSITRRMIVVVGNTIDNGYTGEFFVDVLYLGDEPTTIEQGERVAQLVLFPIVTPPIMTVESLPETIRGVNGFGSTGKK